MSISFGAAGHQAIVTFTDAQIKALQDLPTIISAPGENRVIIPTKVFAIIDAMAGAYTLASNKALVVSTTDGDTWFQYDNVGSIFEDDSQISFIELADLFSGSTWNLANFSNKAVGAYLTANPTGGNAANTLQIIIQYLILNTSTGQFE